MASLFLTMEMISDALTQGKLCNCHEIIQHHIPFFVVFLHSFIQLQLSNGTRIIADDITRSLKGVGALETTIACYAYRNDVNVMEKGICDGAVLVPNFFKLD